MVVRVEEVAGVFSIMPTPATADATDSWERRTVDVEEARRGGDLLASAGVAAVMGAGTLGEGATLTPEELDDFGRAVVDGVNGRCPVLLGPTALSTRETIQRGEVLQNAGVDGFLLGRPMWCALSGDATVEYYGSVAAALPEMAIVVYDNPVAFKGKIAASTYRQLAAIDQVIAAKYSLFSSQYFADLEAVGDQMRIMPIDYQWYYAWQIDQDRSPACWSSGASCGPAPVLALQQALRGGDLPTAKRITQELHDALYLLYPGGDVDLFLDFNIPIDKVMYDEAGYIHAGPARAPYHIAPKEYLEGGVLAGQRLAELHEAYSRGG